MHIHTILSHAHLCVTAPTPLSPLLRFEVRQGDPCLFGWLLCVNTYPVIGHEFQAPMGAYSNTVLPVAQKPGSLTQHQWRQTGNFTVYVQFFAKSNQTSSD